MASSSKLTQGSRDRRKLAVAHKPLKLAGLSATPSVNAEQGGDAIVRNISATGVLLETERQLTVGETVNINLGSAGRHLAEIKWTDAGLVGCEFAAALSKGLFSAALLQGEAPSFPDGIAPDGKGSRRALSSDRKQAGLAIAWARRSRGMNQCELASAIGFSTTTVCRWEQGRVQPRAKARALLEKHLGKLDFEIPQASEKLLPPEPTPKREIGAVLDACKVEIATVMGLSPQQITVEIAVHLSA